MTTREEWARAVLASPRIAAAQIPDTEQNVLALVSVETGEDTAAAWNPAATTWPMPGAVPFNTIPTAGGGVVHVWNYATEADGIDATVSTLLELDHNGQPVYGAVLAPLRTGNDARATCEQWALSPWGTRDAVAALEAVQANPAPYYGALVGVSAGAPNPPAQQPPAPPAIPDTPNQPQEVDVQVEQLSAASPGPSVVSGQVKTVQAKLALVGFGGHLGPSGADGRFGPATAFAVEAFQAAHGLTQDGVVGPLTWAAIVNA